MLVSTLVIRRSSPNPLHALAQRHLRAAHAHHGSVTAAYAEEQMAFVCGREKKARDQPPNLREAIRLAKSGTRVYDVEDWVQRPLPRPCLKTSLTMRIHQAVSLETSSIMNFHSGRVTSWKSVIALDSKTVRVILRPFMNLASRSFLVSNPRRYRITDRTRLDISYRSFPELKIHAEGVGL